MSSYLAFPPSPRMPWGIQKARFFTRSRTRVRQRGKTRLNKRIENWNSNLCENSYLSSFENKRAVSTRTLSSLYPRLLFCALHDSLGSLFLLHFPDGYPWLTLSAILSFEARTFLTVIPFGNIPRDRLAELCYYYTVSERICQEMRQQKNYLM